MSVKQQQLRPIKRRGLAPLLSRDMLDLAGPWLRLIAGLALIAYTSYTTIVGVGEDFAPLLTGSLYGIISVRLASGLLAAALISLVQWLTSERHKVVYLIFLLIDARYTQRQIGPAVEALSVYHLRNLDFWLPTVVSFAVSWSLSLIAARYGEILLFGKRRRPRKDDEE